MNGTSNSEFSTVEGHKCIILGAGEYYGNERDALAAFVADGGALIIAADGGLDHASALGLTPDYVIGDFDSATGGAPNDALSHVGAINSDDDSASACPPTDGACFAQTASCDAADVFSASVSVARRAPDHAGFDGNVVYTIALPAQKDDTDMVSAVKVGWALGARRFLIAGGLGGRLDHTLGNLAELALISQAGGAAWLVGDGVLATAVTDGAVCLPAWQGPADAGDVALPVPGPVFAAGPWVGVASLSDVSRGVSIEGLKYVYEGGMRNTAAFTSNEYVGRAARVGVASGTILVTYPAELGPDVRVTRVTEAASLGALSTQVSDRLAR